MKVQKVELKELGFVEVDGEFVQQFTNQKVYPAFLTNAAIKRGHDMGMIETSLWEDLLKIKGLETVVDATDEEAALQAMNTFDEQRLIGVVYLSVIGANRQLTYSFEEFLERYHYSFEETIQLYANLLVNMISSSPNEFSKELTKATKKNKKKRR